MNIYDAMAIVFGDCPACDAKAGEECMNRRGQRSGGTHWQRKSAVQEWRRADHQKLYGQFRLAAIEWLGHKEQPEYRAAKEKK